MGSTLFAAVLGSTVLHPRGCGAPLRHGHGCRAPIVVQTSCGWVDLEPSGRVARLPRFFGGGRRFRVLGVVIVDEEDESRFVGQLQVEAA